MPRVRIAPGRLPGTGIALVVAAGVTLTSDGVTLHNLDVEGTQTIRPNGQGIGASVLNSLAHRQRHGRQLDRQDLDINDNALILLNSNTVNKAASLSMLQSQVASGRDGGPWGGNGITSSTTATTANTTLAIVDNAELGAGTFRGQVGLDSNTLIVVQAELGDVNLNGTVDFGDLLIVAQNFGEQGVGWAAGNLDGTNGVDFGDLLLVARSSSASLSRCWPMRMPPVRFPNPRVSRYSCAGRRVCCSGEGRLRS